MKNNKNKSEIGPLLLYAAVMLLAVFVVAGYCLDPIFPLYERYGLVVMELVIVVSFVLGFIGSVIIHELGHLIFGLLSGYSFVSFRIFSFILINTGNGIKLKKYSIPGTVGQCLLAPPKLKDRKMPILLYNLGGCIVGFTCGIFFTVLAIIAKGAPMLYTVFLMSAMSNFITALLNGIPMKSALVNNDGMNAVSLGRNTEAIYALWLQLSINERETAGQRICEMPSEWFYFPEDSKLDNPMITSIAYLTCLRLIDMHDYRAAREAIEHLFDVDASLIGVHRMFLLIELGYIASITSDRDLAERIFDTELLKYKEISKRFLCAQRARYAYAALILKDENMMSNAKKSFDSILKKRKNYAYPKEMELEMALINEIDLLRSGLYRTEKDY